MTLPQPAEVTRIADELLSVYAQAQAEIDARLAAIADDPNERRLRARLREMTRAVDAAMTDVQAETRAWLESGRLTDIYLLGAEAAAQVTSRPFTWTAIHREAVQQLAADTFGDLLEATTFMRQDAKGLVREVLRTRTRAAVVTGDSLDRVARDAASIIRERGVAGIRYANGARHSLLDHADVVVRTKSAVGFNLGTLNASLAAGVEWFEITDGADCSWSGPHGSGDLANGTIRSAQEVAAHPVGHPRCARGISPAPGIKSKADADAARRFTPAEQEALALEERARAETHTVRGRLTARERQRRAAARQAGRPRRQARTARTPRRAPAPAPAPVARTWNDRLDPTDVQFPGDMTPAKATEWLNERYGVDEDGKRRYIDVTGMGKQGANDMARVMDRLMRQCPNTAKRIRTFGGSAEVSKAYKQRGARVSQIAPRSYADAVRELGGIRVSGSKAKKYDDMVASLARDVSTGFHPPGTGENIDGIVAHEFGHHAYWTARSGGAGRPVFDEVNQRMVDVVSEIERAIDDEVKAVRGLDRSAGGPFQRARYEVTRDGVSRYATTNHDELVAEAFSEVAMNAEPRSLARRIVEIVLRHAEGEP